MVVDMLPAVVEFYLLQAMELVGEGMAPVPSVRGWRRQVSQLLADYETGLALRLRDYMILACFGEARHAQEQCSHMLSELPRCDSRSGAASVALGYDPQSILEATAHLFEVGSWGQNYGGSSWARVARCAMNYGSVSDRIFVDGVVNLTHNSGTAFDKVDYGLVVTRRPSLYDDFLDFKCGSKSPADLLCTYGALLPHGSAAEALLVNCMARLGLGDPTSRDNYSGVSAAYRDEDRLEHAVVSYRGTTWGTRELHPYLSDSEEYESEEEGEEEEEEEEGEEEEEEEEHEHEEEEEHEHEEEEEEVGGDNRKGSKDKGVASPPAASTALIDEPLFVKIALPFSAYLVPEGAPNE